MSNQVLNAVERNLNAFRHVSQEAEPVGLELGSTWYKPSVDTTYKLVDDGGMQRWEHLSGTSTKQDIVDPTNNDDTANGYSVGSIWVNTVTLKCFTLVDGTAGSAVWMRSVDSNGDTMSGSLILNADPVGLMEAATKQYVDASTAGTDTEGIQDIVGEMFDGSQNGVSVSYDDPNGKLTIDVDDPVITIDGAVTGSNTMVNLGDVTIGTTISTINNVTDVNTAASLHGDILVKNGVEWKSTDTFDAGIF